MGMAVPVISVEVARGFCPDSQLMEVAQYMFCALPSWVSGTGARSGIHSMEGVVLIVAQPLPGPGPQIPECFETRVIVGPRLQFSLGPY